MSEVNYKDKNSESKTFNILLWILLLCLLFIPGYFFYIYFLSTDAQEKETGEQAESIDTSADSQNSTGDEDTENIYNENPVQGKNFFEKFPLIENEQSYVAIPMRVDTNNPPSIVIYNHGDYETVLNTVSSNFMEKLRKYSEVFTSNNYILAASSIHDNENLNNNSIEDIKLLIEWIQSNYDSSAYIYLIGFSRGGYTTTNYIVEYPESIKGVALLAPATYYTEWNQSRVNIIKNIPIQIWHGTNDTNIAVIHSENFINRLSKYDKEVILNKEEGKTHYDVDDEYINDILTFFESTIQ